MIQQNIAVNFDTQNNRFEFNKQSMKRGQEKAGRMPRRPGVIKTIKAAPMQELKRSCESTETQSSFTQEFLSLSISQSKELKDLYYDNKFEDQQIFKEMKCIIENLIKKNDFLIRDRAKLIKENFQLQKMLQNNCKTDSNKKFEEQLQNKIRKIDRQRQTQAYMINSLEGKLDFFTLSKVASKNKIFLEPPLQTHRSEHHYQHQIFQVNNYEKFQSWGNSFKENSDPYCDSISQSKVKYLNVQDYQYRRFKNVQEKQSLFLLRSGESGKLCQNISQYCNTKRDVVDQTSLADEMKKQMRNRLKQFNTQNSVSLKFIQNSDNSNLIMASKDSYKCYQDLQIKPKDSFSISQIQYNEDRHELAMLELKNCEQINSLMASKQIYPQSSEETENGQYYAETPRNANPRIYQYFMSGESQQGLAIPQLETPTLETQQTQRNYQSQMLGQINNGENRVSGHSPLLQFEEALNRSTQDADIIRCESFTKFSPLRCFYICMLNNRQMVGHFMDLLSEFRENEDEIINELYRDNKLWVQVAEKFVKDYWRGTLYSDRETDRYLMENSLSASSLMRYITDNQLIDIIMIAILKKRLRFIFDSNQNSFMETYEGNNGGYRSQPQSYDADQIFKALANQFNLELMRFGDAYKFYKTDNCQSNDGDSYLLASNNENIRFANSNGLNFKQLKNQQEKQITPIFTIYHRQDLGMFQFILPKNQITKEDMKFMNKRMQGRPCFYSASLESQDSISYHFNQNLSNFSRSISQQNRQMILQQQFPGRLNLKKEGQQVQFQCSSISEYPMSVNNKSQRLLLQSVEPSANKTILVEDKNEQKQKQESYRHANEGYSYEVSNFGQNKRRCQLNQTGKMRLALQEISLNQNKKVSNNINTQQRYQIISQGAFLYNEQINKVQSVTKKPIIPPLKLWKQSNENIQRLNLDSDNKNKAIVISRPTSNGYPSMENSFMTVNLDSKRNQTDKNERHGKQQNWGIGCECDEQ